MVLKIKCYGTTQTFSMKQTKKKTSCRKEYLTLYGPNSFIRRFSGHNLR